MNQDFLVPINRISGQKFSKYFYDVLTGNVISHKASFPRTLAWVGTGVLKTSLSPDDTWQNQLRVSKEDIVDSIENTAAYREAVSKCGEFKKITSAIASKIGQPNSTGKIWVIGSINDDGLLSFAVNPRPHYSEESAKDEVLRLKTLNPTKVFVYYVECNRTVSKNDIWVR